MTEVLPPARVSHPDIIDDYPVTLSHEIPTPVAAARFERDDENWLNYARCSSNGQMTELFFSVEPDDIERARAFCGGCIVREECLVEGITMRELGVWGGELLNHGKVVEVKRSRGRPAAPKG